MVIAGWEGDVLYWFQSIHSDILDGVFKFFTLLGEKGLFWIAVILLFLLFSKDKRIGITGILALVLDIVLCNLILKNLVARDRPAWIDTSVPLLVERPDDFSFPSGHTAFSFAAAATIVQYRRGLGAGALVLASLVAVSRLYLFVHFPTDVIGGFLVGITCALLCGIIVKRLFEYKGWSTTDGWHSFKPIREEDT